MSSSLLQLSDYDDDEDENEQHDVYEDARKETKFLNNNNNHNHNNSFSQTEFSRGHSLVDYAHEEEEDFFDNEQNTGTVILNPDILNNNGHNSSISSPPTQNPAKIANPPFTPPTKEPLNMVLGATREEEYSEEISTSTLAFSSSTLPSSFSSFSSTFTSSSSSSFSSLHSSSPHSSSSSSSIFSQSPSQSPFPFSSSPFSSSCSSSSQWHPLVPAEPSADPSNPTHTKLIELVKKLHAYRKKGRNFINELRSSKDFMNPEILEKLISFCNINEIGSEYPTELFDPFDYSEEDCYQKLAEKQVRYHEEKERAKQSANRMRVEFNSGEILNTFAANNINLNNNSLITNNGISNKHRPLVQVIDGNKQLGNMIVKTSSGVDRTKSSTNSTRRASKWDKREPSQPESLNLSTKRGLETEVSGSSPSKKIKGN